MATKLAVRRWQFAVGMFLIGLGGHAQVQSVAPSTKTDPKVEARVEALLKQMTLDEKIGLIHGGPDGFSIGPIDRLKIPKITMTDGPMGTRNAGPATAFAAGVCLASTYDPDLAFKMGQAMGREARARGNAFLLAPAVNINRGPWLGRNFEYYGEDPYLAGQMAAAFIRGVQSEGVIATVKHFALNNQENERNTANSVCDEQTMREVYLPAFEAAVMEGGAWAVMCSYNKVNGTYASANTHLLTDVLKKDWGFQGLVMSDWGAVHETTGPINAGLDLEMPTGAFFNSQALNPLIQGGQVKETTIDDKVRRILRTLVTFGLLDRAQKLAESPQQVNLDREVSLQSAREGIVLLRNTANALPFDSGSVNKVAVVGPNADPSPWGGGGSSFIDADHRTSVLQGMKSVAPGAAFSAVPYKFVGGGEMFSNSIWKTNQGADGLTAEYFDNMKLEGAQPRVWIDQFIDHDWHKAAPFNGAKTDGFSIRWTGTMTPKETGDYEFVLGSDDGSRMYIDGKLAINMWNDQAYTEGRAVVHLEAGKPVPVKIEYFENSDNASCRCGYRFLPKDPFTTEEQAAKGADAAVVCVGFNPNSEGEGFDRSFSLPEGQDELIQAVAAANKRTIVVVNAGGQVDDHLWREKVSAIVYAWYPGEDGGQAVAEVLWGKINPSGHLVSTFYNEGEIADVEALFRPDGGTVHYTDRLSGGYRRDYRRNGPPDHAFGDGLSYTTFAYSDLSVSKSAAGLDVTFKAKNTGKMAGDAVPQVYVKRPSEADGRSPHWWLRGFTRVALKPGEEKLVKVHVDKQGLSYWDPVSSSWILDPGNYAVHVGGLLDPTALESKVQWP